MRMFNVGLAASAALSALDMVSLAPLHPTGKHHKGSTRYPTGHKPNRSHYRPHQGEREIARRLRQKARDKQNQEARAMWRLGSHAFAGCDEQGCDNLVIRVSRRGRVVTTRQEEA